MRTTSILMAAIVMGLSQKSYALTVLVDGAWVRAGLGSAGDRCLDKILLDLKPGDTIEIMMPAPDANAGVNRLAEFTAQRRPGVRAAVLIATRRLLNQVLTSVEPTDWPSLAQILTRLAAVASSAEWRAADRYFVVGALTAADPPAIDLDLQRLLGGRRIAVVALPQPNIGRRDARLKAWQRFFVTAGVAELEILHLSTSNKARAIDCSGRWLQVLDH